MWYKEAKSSPVGKAPVPMESKLNYEEDITGMRGKGNETYNPYLQ